jgi:multiple sugar transport system permease protein
MQQLTGFFGEQHARPKQNEKRSKRARREARAFYFFVGPWLLGFFGLSLFPLVLGFIISLSNYDGFNLATVRFMGAKNYVRALESADMWLALRNTALYGLITVPVGLVIGLMLAVMLNRAIKGRAFFRMLYYLPSILPLAGAVMAWRLLFNKNAGLVNGILSFFRPGTAINWPNDHFMLLLYLFAWWNIGGAMVIFLAGLQGVPEELREAAKLDGANRAQIFRSVTIPLLTPVIFFQLILGLIGSLQILDAAILLYGRTGLSGSITMPAEKYFYMVYNYSQVFDFQRYGYGVALSWIFFVIILVLTVLIVATSRYWVYYEVSQEGK